MGLEPRVQALMSAAPDDVRRTEISQAAQRLVDPTGMGKQYKILGIVPWENGMPNADDSRIQNEIYPFLH
jgi:NADH dehydrogenase [ubiquinone] 1 alpha subcomplex assembly factor 7